MPKRKRPDDGSSAQGSADEEHGNQGADEDSATQAGADEEHGNQGAASEPSQLEELTALVQQFTGAVEDRFTAVDKRLDAYSAEERDQNAAIRGLAEQLYDFGVRLGLIPKGTPSPAAATAAAAEPPELVHDGVAWVPKKDENA